MMINDANGAAEPKRWLRMQQSTVQLGNYSQTIKQPTFGKTRRQQKQVLLRHILKPQRYEKEEEKSLCAAFSIKP